MAFLFFGCFGLMMSLRFLTDSLWGLLLGASIATCGSGLVMLRTEVAGR